MKKQRNFGKWATAIAGALFLFLNIAKVFYEGTASKWNGTTITVDPSNLMYLTMYADIYFYSETAPGSGNYWRFVDGVATPY